MYIKHNSYFVLQILFGKHGICFQTLRMLATILQYLFLLHVAKQFHISYIRCMHYLVLSCQNGLTFVREHYHSTSVMFLIECCSVFTYLFKCMSPSTKTDKCLMKIIFLPCHYPLFSLTGLFNYHKNEVTEFINLLTDHSPELQQ